LSKEIIQTDQAPGAIGPYSQAIKKNSMVMDDFPRVNEVYGEYFKNDPPARACVEVSRLPKSVQVEIEAIAIL